MTIDDLARRAETTTRNIRAYRTKGLLPPPRLAGRVGYYDESHLTRLRLIDRLQKRGFALEAIKALVSAWERGSSLSDVLGFDDALLAPWSDETPQVVSREALIELFPEIEADEGLLARAVDLGLVAAKNGEFKLPSPRLISVGAELVRVGIPLRVVLDYAAALDCDTQAIAERLVGLFQAHVWEPFLSGRSSMRELSEVTEVLQRLRPLASESVQIFLARAMEQKTAEAAAGEIQAQPSGQ